MSQCISHASQRYKEKAPKAIVPEAFNTNLTFLGFRATNERKISPVKHQSKFGFISENAPKNENGRLVSLVKDDGIDNTYFTYDDGTGRR